MINPREWWIGLTADGFSKWLTQKHPQEHKCRSVFLSSDGKDECVEYIPVIELSALKAAEAEMIKYRNYWESAEVTIKLLTSRIDELEGKK